MLELSDRGRRDRTAADEAVFIPWSKTETPARVRRERLSVAIFTGVNVAIFMILVCCVFAAALLYNRWH